MNPTRRLGWDSSVTLKSSLLTSLATVFSGFSGPFPLSTPASAAFRAGQETSSFQSDVDLIVKLTSDVTGSSCTGCDNCVWSIRSGDVMCRTDAQHRFYKRRTVCSPVPVPSIYRSVLVEHHHAESGRARDTIYCTRILDGSVRASMQCVNVSNRYDTELCHRGERERKRLRKLNLLKVIRGRQSRNCRVKPLLSRINK